MITCLSALFRTHAGPGLAMASAERESDMTALAILEVSAADAMPGAQARPQPKRRACLLLSPTEALHLAAARTGAFDRCRRHACALALIATLARPAAV